MGLFQRLFGRSALEVAERPLVEVETVSGFLTRDPGVPLQNWRVGDIEALWKSQPNLRKVVDFAARNISTIPLRVYERDVNDSRTRVRSGKLADLLASPAPPMGSGRFWNGIIHDALLYDRWCLITVMDKEGKPRLVHVPAWRLRIKTDALNQLESVKYLVSTVAGQKVWETVDLDQAVIWYGYAPNEAGSSMVWTLLDVLGESAESVRYRRQLWDNGARVPAWIERPSDAPAWSDEAKLKWGRGFRSSYTGDGSKAGGVPLLEDGMKLHDTGAFKPNETENLEGRELSAVEVAAAFHIAPELVGVRQGNYANVDAYRQMLYRESLGPYIDDWVQAINTQLTPRFCEGRALYVEPHLDAKLRGSFLEEAQVLTTSTGAPWLAVNEARPIQNLPKLPGAEFDLPVQPMNLVYGGQMPSLAGQQNRGPKAKGVVLAREDAGLRVKGEPGEEDTAQTEAVLRKFFTRQRDVILSRLGAKADADWWDQDRWDDELAADLYSLALDVTGRIGMQTAKELGLPPSDYDVDRTRAFLEQVAKSRAQMLNAATLRQLEAALADDLSDDAEKSTPAGVFDEALTSRAAQAALTLATTFATFAVTEMGRQLGRPGVMKTWVVTSANPRPSHAVMDGETVPIDEPYSNNLMWPGDISGAAGDAGEISNCSCQSVLLIP